MAHGDFSFCTYDNRSVIISYGIVNLDGDKAKFGYIVNKYERLKLPSKWVWRGLKTRTSTTLGKIKFPPRKKFKIN